MLSRVDSLERTTEPTRHHPRTATGFTRKNTRDLQVLAGMWERELSSVAAECKSDGFSGNSLTAPQKGKQRLSL